MYKVGNNSKHYLYVELVVKRGTEPENGCILQCSHRTHNGQTLALSPLFHSLETLATESYAQIELDSGNQQFPGPNCPWCIPQEGLLLLQAGKAGSL
jgi:hypothetical protein